MRSFAAIKIKGIPRNDSSARATSICVARCMHVILHILLEAQTKDSPDIDELRQRYSYTGNTVSNIEQSFFPSQFIYILLQCCCRCFFSRVLRKSFIVRFRDVNHRHDVTEICYTLSAIKLNAANFCYCFFFGVYNFEAHNNRKVLEYQLKMLTHVQIHKHNIQQMLQKIYINDS